MRVVLDAACVEGVVDLDVEELVPLVVEPRNVDAGRRLYLMDRDFLSAACHTEGGDAEKHETREIDLVHCPALCEGLVQSGSWT